MQSEPARALVGDADQLTGMERSAIFRWFVNSGTERVDCQALFTEDESQVLLVLTATPRSEAESRLQMLAVLGTQQLADER